jgi:hypothetical protein
MSKGRKFLAEAERYLPSYQLEKGEGVRLASLQGALLLYERLEGITFASSARTGNI